MLSLLKVMVQTKEEQVVQLCGRTTIAGGVVTEGLGVLRRWKGVSHRYSRMPWLRLSAVLLLHYLLPH